MEQEEEVVYSKVFDEKKGDVVFEGKVSTDVEPHELVWLRCFRERYLGGIYSKATNEKVESFKGLQNNVELVAGSGAYERFSGVLYVGADDGVLRTSKKVPSCECVKMSLWKVSHEECEKAFKCETLEELEINKCDLTYIPNGIGKMKKLKKLRLQKLWWLKFYREDIEEMGELSNLEELHIRACRIESLPKRLKDLKMLKWISLRDLSRLQLNTHDLVVLSKLNHLTIVNCDNAFTPSFWKMIKSTTDLRVLVLDWYSHNQEMVVAALEENGSIVDAGLFSGVYAHFLRRNKANHERAMECVVHMLAIRRWRNALNNVPKEMVKMIAMMLWITKCDVDAWTKK